MVENNDTVEEPKSVPIRYKSLLTETIVEVIWMNPLKVKYKRVVPLNVEGDIYEIFTKPYYVFKQCYKQLN